VGTPLFTPPELQGKTFRGLHRTESHDRFGLAVLIFHLLFQGRHPFAGVFADGEMPLERAIAESRFAYGAHAASLGMAQPPGTLALTTFGRPIARLFERAFAPPGGGEERPSAIEWIEALQSLEQELAACGRRPRHFHPGGADCCWCAIEDRTGAQLFGEGQEAVTDNDAVTAEALWKAIEGVQPPTELALPKFAEQEADSIATGQKWDKVVDVFLDRLPTLLATGMVAVAIVGTSSIGVPKSLFLIGAIVSAGIFVASAFTHRTHPSRTRRALRIEWNRAIAQWRNHSSMGLFTSARLQLEQARRSIAELHVGERNELERLERLLELRQLDGYLATFETARGLFLEVTRSDIEKLASRGIRSAGDIRRRKGRLHELISKVATTELRSWAEKCAQSFMFDKRDPTYLADAAKIAAKYRREHAHLLEVLRQGPALLNAKRDEVARERARAEDVLRRKHEYLRQRRKKENQ
jgi:DNA-binding helix-hairpin-helix protein with protein kinase domain